MNKKQYKVKADPELLRQISSVAASDEPIQAVFTLSLPLKKLLDPQIVEEKAKQIVGKVSDETGEAPQDMNVFRNLGSFVVSASAPFIRKMLNESGLSAAVANKQPKGSIKLKTA
jgi:chaperonin cofactor prefoldin